MSIGMFSTGSYYGVSSGFFNSYNQSNNTSVNAGNSSILSDYASVKNGSYRKLISAYYKGNDTAKQLVGKGFYNTATDKVNTTALRDEASALAESASKLTDTGKDSLFTKKTIKTEDGKETTDYDREAIGSAIAKFADDYNSMIDSAGDSNSKSTLRTAASMTTFVKANSNLLNQVGVKVGSDNKLTIDAPKLQNADINKISTLFNGRQSVAGNIQSGATQIYNQSVSQLANMSNSLYSANGRYSFDGSTYNQYL